MNIAFWYGIDRGTIARFSPMSSSGAVTFSIAMLISIATGLVARGNFGPCSPITINYKERGGQNLK